MYDELIKALNTIKECCNNSCGRKHSCKSCPLADSDGMICRIKEHFPCDWKIKEPKEVIRIME